MKTYEKDAQCSEQISKSNEESGEVLTAWPEQRSRSEPKHGRVYDLSKHRLNTRIKPRLSQHMKQDQNTNTQGEM